MSSTYETQATQPIASPSKADDVVVDEARAALVKRKIEGVQRAKKKWAKAFRRMREDMKFAEGEQRRNQKEDDERVQIDIIQRHVNSRTAALYAKNPQVLAKRRPRMDFALWDETHQSLEALMQRAATMTIGPDDLPLMQDIAQGMQKRKMLERLGKTMTLMFNYSLDEQEPAFKEQAKQLVVRTLTCGVGYTRSGYQRALQKSPETQQALADATDQVATLMRLQQDLQEGEIDTYAPEIEEHRLIAAELEAKPDDVVVREGLAYSFPASTRVIPDEGCTALAGFLGCARVAVEHSLTSDEIEERWHVKVKGSANPYTARDNGEMKMTNVDREDCVYCVWEIFDKADGLVYIVCDGYKDFLEEPAAPDVKVSSFWPIRPLIFNRVESETNPFPRSDVRLLRSLQKEINRLAEDTRQHRIAARPLYASIPGAFDEDEKKNLANHAAHEVIELKNASVDTDINKIIQQIKKVPIDPNLYTTDPIYDAINRVVGSQEANLGGTSGATATESSISEASRISSLASNTDDLDEFLTALAKDGGRILLLEMEDATVVATLGPGAIWPTFSNQQLADDVSLEIKAGSTGRPNRAMDLANAEKGMPFLLQLPGISVEALITWFLGILDEKLDVADWYAEGMPSITAQNAQKQIGTGDPATDPNQQGGQGAQNAPNNDQSQPGPQPAYPVAPSPIGGVLPAPGG